AEAGAYLRTLRSILQYLEICDGNMEEGSFRCDADVSVRRAGTTALGTKVEIKNRNSFRAVEKAIAYEIERQSDALARGERLVQETRLWDAEREETRPMRSKEHAHDYRYFPEPDLLPLVVERAWVDEIRVTLPELPAARRERFVRDHQLSPYDAEGLAQVSDRGALEAAAAEVLAKHPAQVAEFRAGKERVLGFLVGQVMKATGGKANPQVVGELLRKALAG